MQYIILFMPMLGLLAGFGWLSRCFCSLERCPFCDSPTIKPYKLVGRKTYWECLTCKWKEE